MKLKKQLLVLIVLAGIIMFMSFDDSPLNETPKDEQSIYEQQSPYATAMWVQKLKEPMEGEGNTMKFMTAYEPGSIKGNSINIFLDRETKITLFDDGKSGGDTKAGDNIFTGLVKEDVKDFEESLKRKQESLHKKGFFLRFEGHLGQMINKDLPKFNFERFSQFDITELPLGIIDATDCTTDILKENSLFITDLAVVEDPSRTYNLCSGQGNPYGAWTFGTMMKSMAYQSVTGVSAKAFIKGWLSTWSINQTVNGQFILNSYTGLTPPATPPPLRDSEMVRSIIKPWLRNSQNNQTLAVSRSNWGTLWNNTHQDSILKYAPFKLTAIVNRLDLRGNTGYVQSITNAGETRFIFSALQMAPGGNCGIPVTIGGREGFNVIFEYGNPQTSCGAMQQFGQQWLNLSDEVLGSTAFNDSLELITNQVTDSGNGGALKANQNCLNQIRTNEIALANGAVFNITQGVNQTILPTNRWRLSQFEIDNITHLPKVVPVTLTTRIHANGGDGLLANMTDRNFSDANVTNDFNYVDSLGKWVNLRRNSFKRGRVSYPLDFANSTKKVLGSHAEVTSAAPNASDYFWDGVNFTVSYDPNGNGLTSFPSVVIDTNKARHQASLNTCGGCHAAETQTMFAHVRYVGMGMSTRYWNDMGNTTPEFTSIGGIKIEHVSAFLTGRKMRDNRFSDNSNSPSGQFADENFDGSEIPDDDSFDGLFYVTDAKGRIDGTNSDMWGFNDLERRKIDLCNFLNSSCNPFAHTIKSFMVARTVMFSPFALHSH